MKRLTLLSATLLVASATTGCCLYDDPCDPCDNGTSLWRPRLFSRFQSPGCDPCCGNACGSPCNNCCPTSCCDPCGGQGGQCGGCNGYGGGNGCGGCNGYGNGGIAPTFGPTVVPGATVIPGTTVVPGPVPQTIPLQPGPTP